MSTLEITFNLSEEHIKRLDEECKNRNQSRNTTLESILENHTRPLPRETWTTDHGTAYHEAGHAVIMIALGEKFIEVRHSA